MAKKSNIGKIASEKTKKAFADEMSNLTILTSDEIQNLFPKKADREELEELYNILNSNIEDNEKKVKLVENIDKIGGAIIKIGKKIFALT